jgi:carboxyl-terminal processing protease
MKRFFFALSVFPFFSLISQTADYCDQQKKLFGVIEKYHYKPPVFDSKTNGEILDLFLERIDPYKIFFYKSDVESLRRLVAAGPAPGVYCELLEKATALYEARLHQADSIMDVIASKPLTLSAKDTVYVHPKVKADYSENVAGVAKRLEKRLKWQVLIRVLKPKDENETVASVNDEKYRKAEPAERKIVAAKEKRGFTLILADDARLREEVFVELNNAICRRCDPHSDYFTLRGKESFEGSLSTSQMGFGFSVSENDEEELVIAYLSPGSPAWKCNELFEEDVLLSVKWPGQEPVDVSYMDSDDFYELMEKSISDEIELKVRHKNNTVKTISLQKAKIETEENVLNSFILSDSSYKLGYIPLPSFYMNADQEGVLGVANDVAKEIIKLKAGNIQGLIIDLRNNGGGSLKEAIDLSGLFIDEGPLALLKSRNEKIQTLRDINRGTMYDGPLLVMVNNYSASASEFFSAAVQDYNRALIVGSTTYGKGTAQNVLPADTNLFYYKNEKNISTGYVKLTMDKFYRVTGITHQASGIKPDIYLPDLLDKISVVEKDKPYVLQPDSVKKKIIFKPNPPLPKEQLRQKSADRVAASTMFTNITKVGNELARVWDEEMKVPLTLQGATNYYKTLADLEERTENALRDTLGTGLKAENNNFSKELMDFSDYKKEQNSRLIEGIQSDIYIKESFLILKDLNIFSKN